MVLWGCGGGPPAAQLRGPMRPLHIVLELRLWSFQDVECHSCCGAVWWVEAVLESFLVLWGCDGGALLWSYFSCFGQGVMWSCAASRGAVVVPSAAQLCGPIGLWAVAALLLWSPFYRHGRASI